MGPEPLVVRYKVHVYGHGPWRRRTVAEMFFAMPHMFLRSERLQPVPPMSVVNSLLSTGGLDERGFGNVEWKPFQIDVDQYDLLVEELLTKPEYSFELRADLDPEMDYPSWREMRLNSYLDQ